MRALALGGDRNGALARYQAYRATLAQELGAEPARRDRGPVRADSHSGILVAPATRRPHRVSEACPEPCEPASPHLRVTASPLRRP